MPLVPISVQRPSLRRCALRHSAYHLPVSSTRDESCSPLVNLVNGEDALVKRRIQDEAIAEILILTIEHLDHAGPGHANKALTRQRSRRSHRPQTAGPVLRWQHGYMLAANSNKEGFPPCPRSFAFPTFRFPDIAGLVDEAKWGT